MRGRRPEMPEGRGAGRYADQKRDRGVAIEPELAGRQTYFDLGQDLSGQGRGTQFLRSGAVLMKEKGFYVT